MTSAQAVDISTEFDQARNHIDLGAKHRMAHLAEAPQWHPTAYHQASMHNTSLILDIRIHVTSLETYIQNFGLTCFNSPVRKTLVRM